MERLKQDPGVKLQVAKRILSAAQSSFGLQMVAQGRNGSQKSCFREVVQRLGRRSSERLEKGCLRGETENSSDKWLQGIALGKNQLAEVSQSF